MDNEFTTITTEEQKVTMKKQILKQSGLGEQLKAAREAMNFSEKEAASRLHLNSRLIALMEAEDFENGPPPTFMRGYLRSYARLVNLNEREVNAAIAHLDSHLVQEPATITPPPINTRPLQSSRRYVRPMTYGVVLALAGLVTIWWNGHSHESTLSKPILAAINEPNATLAPNSTEISKTLTETALPPEPTLPPLQTAEAKPATAAPAAQPVAPSSQEAAANASQNPTAGTEQPTTLADNNKSAADTEKSNDDPYTDF